MATYHGKGAHLTVAAQNLSAHITDIDFPRSTDMAESSTLGDEAKEFLSGLTDATLSISGRWDDTVTTGPDAVLAPLVGAETSSAIVFGPSGSTTGRVRYTFNAFCTSYQTTASIGDVVAFAASFQVSGAVVRDTFPI